MLILSRKQEESILVGDNVKIKVLSIEKGNVKLGIEAPSDISILRQELTEAVSDINKKASKNVDKSVLDAFFQTFSK